MNAALGLANQKLYHAAVLIRMLANERERQQVPLPVLLEAVGEAVRWHLRAGYGWFLLALADVDALPAEPPSDVAELVQSLGLTEPLRGELVELRRMEGSGWLAALLETPRPGAMRRSGGELSVAEAGADEAQFQRWHDELEKTIDRMSHGLEEW